MDKLLCPSMMCADYGRLAEEIKALDEAGVDIFHCDIMDGTFVPNITMGLMDLKTIRKYTKKPVDVHLMIENPGEKVDWFLDAGADGFILGTSALFGKGRPYAEIIPELRGEKA